MIAKPFKTKASHMRTKLHSSHEKNLAHLSNQLSQLSITLTYPIKHIANIQNNLLKQVSLINSYIKTNERLFDKLRDIQIEYSKDKVLYDHGWLITPYISRSNLYHKLEKYSFEEFKEKTNKQWNEFFVEFFIQNDFEELIKMVETWSVNKLFKRRYKLIQDSLFLIKSYYKKSGPMTINPSSMVIPVLIAQIDGVTLDIALAIGYQIRAKQSSQFIDGNERLVEKYTIFDELPVNSLHDINSLDLIRECLFSKAYPRQSPVKTIKKRPFVSFNRHKIMHGESIKYGTIDNTIRLFLILDFLLNLKVR